MPPAKGPKESTLEFSAGHGQGQASIGFVKADNKYVLLTCGSDGSACMRDPKTLEAKGSCTTGDGPCNVIAAHPKGGSAALGSENYIKVTGEQLVHGICHDQPCPPC